MVLFPKRRTALKTGVAAAVALALPSARACEFFSRTLRVYHPWTRARPQSAAFAVVCMKFDQVEIADRLIGVATPVAARTELAGREEARSEIDLPIPAGQETVLGETGATLRLVGLKHALELGRSYPLELTFETGGVLSATLQVDYARFG
jgi:periplasmic copper chaperone A